ncbi:MAG: hypothetical protein FE045_02530 [Thermoplasmata archaeon]|nr:MAG: hypothetical protein FE045_02530 [Thermoplasmata archaeon]
MEYDYVAYDMENNASFTMNDIYIQNNNITTDDDGICIYYYDYDVGYDACDNVTIEMPYYYISNNNILADGYGICFHTYSNPDDIYDNAIVDFGALYIDNNNISCDYGIYLYLEDMPENSYDNAIFTFNDIVITNNRILNCTHEGIYIYVDDVPYYPEDDSQLIFGDIIISVNELHNCSNGIYIEYNPETYENVQGYYGYINITDNIITDMINDAIYIYYYPYAYDSSAIYMKGTNIRNNTISNCSDGIYMGGDVHKDSTAILDMDGAIINNNTISNCSGEDSGIHIEAIDGNKIMNNTLYNCSYGIALIGSANNYVFNNSIYGVVAEEACGIYLDEVNESEFINNTVFNFEMVTGAATGIYVGYSCNNTFDGIAIHKLDLAVQQDYGIVMKEADNNSFNHVEIYDLNGEIGYGVFIQNSSNNVFNDTYIHDINAIHAHAFYSDNRSKNNIVNDLTVARYPITVSFVYGNGIALKGVNESLPENDGLLPINKFINISNMTATSWINITFYYNDSDVENVREDSLSLYEWNGSSWNEIESILDAENNTINANISSFSIYGIFGELNYLYKLHKGWNLITVPINVTWHAWDLANYINTHNNLSNNIVTTIVMFNAMTQHYAGWVAAVPDYNNFTIEPGMGYWIYVAENVTITWQGRLASVDIQLQKGYNMIGWTSLQNGNASVALHKIKNATVAITWNESVHEYETSVKTRWGIHGDNFGLELGKGFYVYCIATDRWHGS